MRRGKSERPKPTHRGVGNYHGNPVAIGHKKSGWRKLIHNEAAEIVGLQDARQFPQLDFDLEKGASASAHQSGKAVGFAHLALSLVYFPLKVASDAEGKIIQTSSFGTAFGAGSANHDHRVTSAF